MIVTWDDELDALFGADLTVALGYRTPAGGVVVQAVAPIGLNDRETGTLGFTTSLGFSKKLERLALDPRVAMAFHAREHGRSSSTRYVLAQGTARVIEQPSEQERALVRANAASYLGAAKQGRLWDYWMREYYVSRVPVEVTVTRICAWPTLDAAGAPEWVIGEPLGSEPAAPQPPPRNGTGPRVDVARAAGRLRATAHILLGYAGSDGAPVVVPVALVTEDAAAGFVLSTASPLPTGGRRAGVLGHSYGAQLIGLNTRQHTGWLEVDDNGVVYAPHTETGYRAPANKTLQMLINGALAKQGVKQSARAARPPDR
jgi:nitroimidazol reductase NimA-like FMN-containing flavoprotein (pyridoxamine 5'-phosphate oxidase superfamily)